MLPIYLAADTERQVISIPELSGHVFTQQIFPEILLRANPAEQAVHSVCSHDAHNQHRR